MSTLILSISNLDQLQHGVTARHAFDCKGGTIGSEGANWLIDDRHHTVAAIHCEIRWLEGGFCVIDRCNRTYLNDSINSLGALPPRRLLEGDQLRIGAYRLHIQYALTHAQSLEDLFSPAPRVLDQLIADAPTQAWQPRHSAPHAAVEICSVFEPASGNDPLAALNAVPDARASEDNLLQRLIAGERP
ncbi:FHA domain-containing protein [Pseudomonas capeferrum]|uniref:FHA domain-containing protein n=1 Tax=Pseudomonas capeferrum TaxID=1495066 RepID=UPI0030DAC4AD